ncbi:DUF5018-related domain-containing protein [Dysgonomonas gadei]|uniref:DUF5018-related domain-containing protein n=1 Tax=Dysgonomonas gadei TaxID=156974 RepID=UPI003AF1420B
MKKIFIICISIIMIIVSFPSCLESGLHDVETYSETKVTAINFEYRWMVQENPNDPWAGEKLQVKTLTAKTIFTDGKIECEITVPAASGTFTAEQRDKVSLQSLIAYMTISPGASVRSNGSAPTLGKLGDFSQSNMSYNVVAADGINKQDWVLVITAFNK